MHVEIRPANMLHLSWIAAYMRPADRAEIMCQLPEGTPTHHLAAALLGGESWIAYIDDDPVAGFGVSPLNVAALSVWAFGTQRMQRTVPAITRFVRDERVPQWVADGYQIMEARSAVEHHVAHRWMLSTGAEIIGPPFPFGRDRNEFLLFRWTASTFAAMSRTPPRRGGAAEEPVNA